MVVVEDIARLLYRSVDNGRFMFMLINMVLGSEQCWEIAMVLSDNVQFSKM